MEKIDKRIVIYVGKRLRIKRRFKDITLDKLASKVGVTPETLSRYEKGEFNLYLVRYAKWCRALKVDGGKLMNEALRHVFRGRG